MESCGWIEWKAAKRMKVILKLSACRMYIEYQGRQFDANRHQRHIVSSNIRSSTVRQYLWPAIVDRSTDLSLVATIHSECLSLCRNCKRLESELKLGLLKLTLQTSKEENTRKCTWSSVTQRSSTLLRSNTSRTTDFSSAGMDFEEKRAVSPAIDESSLYVPKFMYDNNLKSDLPRARHYRTILRRRHLYHIAAASFSFF
ncbi:unnamed protein product [Brugia pahangi]|uniref:Mitochondria-eating protein n=1 Tax=Brugia pahangi TaxID=6280 RepID=A0A0N4T4D6_BRUPA|nr:unnamed protein product [Brugia pahangi]